MSQASEKKSHKNVNLGYKSHNVVKKRQKCKFR